MIAESSRLVHMYSQFSGHKYQENKSLTRATRGTDRSPEYNEHFCYMLDFLA